MDFWVINDHENKINKCNIQYFVFFAMDTHQENREEQGLKTNNRSAKVSLHTITLLGPWKIRGAFFIYFCTMCITHILGRWGLCTLFWSSENLGKQLWTVHGHGPINGIFISIKTYNLIYNEIEPINAHFYDGIQVVLTIYSLE